MKFLTPGQMLICLLLFFLPWVELQCFMPKGAMGGMGGGMKIGAGMPEPNIDMKDGSWSGLVSQSGFQAATGKYTLDPKFDDLMAMGAKKDSTKDGPNPDAAPLLWVYLLAVLAAVGAGFAMPSGGARKAVLAACCGLALVVAAGQAAIGFPLAKDDKADKNANKGGKAEMNMGMPGGEMTRTKLLFPFYLSLLLCVGGLVTALIEPSGGAKSRKPKPEEADDEYLPPENGR